MKQKIFNNILMNFALMVFFVILNNWLLQKGFEETFVLLSIINGIVVVIANAVFIDRCCRK